MATRIDIELTSSQDDGSTFTWRAAGARQPKGAAAASLFPAGASVGDEFRVEAEMDLDGTRITAVLPPKEKPGKAFETLELIARDDEPLVTQQLAEKGRRDRGDRAGGRGRGRGGDGDRGPRGDGRGRGEGRGRGRDDKPRTPAKPKLPPKPKPPRLKAGKANRNALLDELPEEHKAVAQELLRGGLQAVRQGLAQQNEQRKVEGANPIDEGPILTLAEELLGKVRAAEWLDRAEAALEQSATVDLRDLRSVVTAADGAAKDEDTRALAARLRTALNERLDADQNDWVNEVVEMLDDDRVVRALHLSSRPPKAGAPLPAPVAMRLVEAANAGMSAEVSPDRWGYLIEALAHSPVRRQVVPVSLPTTVTDELKATIAKHGNRLPELAQIFGIEPDPKAGRDRKRRGGKGGKKGAPKKGDAAPAPSAEDASPAAETEAPAPTAPDAPAAADAPVETAAPAPESPAPEAPEPADDAAEQATPVAEAPEAPTPDADATPSADDETTDAG